MSFLCQPNASIGQNKLPQCSLWKMVFTSHAKKSERSVREFDMSYLIKSFKELTTKAGVFLAFMNKNAVVQASRTIYITKSRCHLLCKIFQIDTWTPRSFFWKVFLNVGSTRFCSYYFSSILSVAQTLTGHRVWTDHADDRWKWLVKSKPTIWYVSIAICLLYSMAPHSYKAAFNLTILLKLPASFGITKLFL